jgi:glycosyltransferase involved in cell wall biosynthesis
MEGSMNYSIIITYRDRFEHLKLLVPRLREVFADSTFEIIVSEQADNNIFRRGNTRNEGFRVSSGDVVIFHDVDYYPIDTMYWHQPCDVYLPVKTATFVLNNMAPREPHDIPGGYRHFKDGVDDNFYGGVLSFKRSAFEKINGFSTAFKGWGFEDVDIRNRVHSYGLTEVRGWGKFAVLNHTDSGPQPDDYHFQNNIRLAGETQAHLHRGLNEPHRPTATVVPSKLAGVDIWVESTNFDAVDKTIVTSNIDWSAM